jgi:3-isopropylmalate/(R)-2-methylmalate dehydratase large subunit
MTPRTLFDKIWDAHVVARRPGHPYVLYVDLHLIHEVTSPQAFEGLRRRRLKVRRPDRTLATMDHSTPTDGRRLAVIDDDARRQLGALAENCRAHGIELLELGSQKNGIVHVVGPELGRTIPGSTIVCGDSHTSTHGAFGALAFGIGTSEVEHVLATQCLLQEKPAPVEVRFEGDLQKGVSAKDLVLAMIAKIGTAGGNGCVFEYTGDAISKLDMEGRMTICNMSIEAGARAGMIAPDDVTFEYLARTPLGSDAVFDRSVERWRSLATDEGAEYARTIRIDAREVAPMITYGTHPGMAIPIEGRVPDPEGHPDRDRLLRALAYMDLEPGQPIEGQRVDVVFLGSCTNSRLSDLRSAAWLMRGRRVASGVRMLVVPGSARVKEDAEAEGLDRIFREAGAEWRSPGCSMCIAMNDDRLQPGQYAVSTSNRNFEGRQGSGGRTFLASPATAAASAIAGCISDPRKLMGGAS